MAEGLWSPQPRVSRVNDGRPRRRGFLRAPKRAAKRSRALKHAATAQTRRRSAAKPELTTPASTSLRVALPPAQQEVVATSKAQRAFRTAGVARRARSDPPSLEVMPHGTRREVTRNRLAASLRSALVHASEAPKRASREAVASAQTRGDRSVLLERASREAVASAHPAPERPRWNRGRSTKASKRAHARRSRASARLASAQTCFRMRHAQRA